MTAADADDFDPTTFDPESSDADDWITAAPLVEDLSPGDVVRTLRELAELTQQQLAETTGIEQSAISAIETGRDNLGIERAKTLARAFGVHPAVIAFPNWRREESSAA